MAAAALFLTNTAVILIIAALHWITDGYGAMDNIH